MAGLLVELAFSWLLLWICCKKDLSVLGIAPTKHRLADLFIGLVIASVCCTLYYLSFTVFTANKWQLNNNFKPQGLLSSSWWTLRSVLFEELLFRGALLYILIQKVGARTACITSAACFGIYHWFTGGVMAPMAIVFIMTGTWGAMFALAFAKTKSLFLPIGLHFGWNFVSTVIFSQGPLGNQFLLMNGGEKLGAALSLAVFIFQVISVPLITYWYLKQKTTIEAGTRIADDEPEKAGLSEQASASVH